MAKEARKTTTFMSMTKHFLLVGKLHRAVIFCMDVPSLLFADASGKVWNLQKCRDG
jgi:hypothetical protein